MKKISRREFLIRSGSGVTCALIAPDFFRQAVEQVEVNGVPLIVTPRDPRTILYAVRQSHDYQLNIGKYDEEPPVLTWREVLGEYWGEDPETMSDEELDDNFGITRAHLDYECESEWYIDSWCRSGSPTAPARLGDREGRLSNADVGS